MSEYRLLQRILRENAPFKGTALEFGVATGTSARIIAEHMPVIGFDSFAGLPEDWVREPTDIGTTFPAGTFACEPPAIDNVLLVVGLFADTLPSMTLPDDITLVHVDADLYSSTKTIFEHIGPALRPGVIIVFDEYEGNGFDDEKCAFEEACADYGWNAYEIGEDGEKKAFALL